MKLLGFFSFIYLLIGAMNVHADITVDAVQPPVWKDTDSGKVAVYPGETIASNQQISTGNNARIRVTLADDSHIELGELSIGNAPNIRSDASLLTATLEVLKGAFRYTTAKFAKNRRRDINIRLPQSTIGIRGTDLWGRVSPKDDFVVLIEGAISIEHASGTTVPLDTPLSVYQADANGPAPVDYTDVPTLLSLAPETALIEDKPALYSDGRFSVVVSSYNKIEWAQNAAQAFAAKGYPASVQSDTVKGSEVNRVVFNGFRSAADALKFIAQMKQQGVFEDGWIRRI